jgi:hypothetical protein
MQERKAKRYRIVSMNKEEEEEEEEKLNSVA